MKSILIVDDNHFEIERMIQILSERGFMVLEANSGLEALEIIEEKPPDLIILDIVMPEINGFELIRELKDNTKSEKIPVIFYSQKNTKIDKSWGLGLGADAYLTKPVEPEQLIEIINKIFA